MKNALNLMRAFMLLIVACLVFTSYALAQSAVGGAIGTTIDLSPMLTLGVQAVSLVVLLVGVWFIYSHTTNQDQRAALTGILEKAVGFGLNAVAGATANKNLNINLGTSTAAMVAATALKYAQQFGPQAIAHFGLDEKSVAKMIVARLPGVDGTIDDTTLNQIVATANTPGSTAPMTDQIKDLLPELTQMLGDYLLARKAGTTTTSTTTTTAAPTAPTAAPPA